MYFHFQALYDGSVCKYMYFHFQAPYGGSINIHGAEVFFLISNLVSSGCSRVGSLFTNEEHKGLARDVFDTHSSRTGSRCR